MELFGDGVRHRTSLHLGPVLMHNALLANHSANRLATRHIDLNNVRPVEVVNRGGVRCLIAAEAKPSCHLPFTVI